MRRAEDLQQNEVGQEAEREEDGAKEEDVCQPENKENGEWGDLLIISMKKTRISVVNGRGCDIRSPCQGCNGTGCTFNDVVMVSESSEVMLGEFVLFYDLLFYPSNLYIFITYTFIQIASLTSGSLFQKLED